MAQDDPSRATTGPSQEFPQELRDQLKNIFVNAHCEDFYEAALEWCVTNGARFLSEVFAEDVYPDFVQEMNLKRLEARRLKLEFEKATGACSRTVTAGSEPVEDAPHVVVVKNTFIDEDRPSQVLLSAANRPKTFAGPTGSLPEERHELDGDDWSAPMTKDEILSNGENIESSSSTNLLQRYQTHDDYGYGYQGARLSEHTETHEDYGFSHPYQAPLVDGNVAGEQTASEKAMEFPFPPLAYPMQLGFPPPGIIPTMIPPNCSSGWPYPGPGNWPGWPLFAPSYPQEGGSSSKPLNVEFVRKHYRRRDGRNEHRNQYHWRVHGSKLRSSDREAVSPIFQVKECGNGNLDFRLVLKPKVVEIGKDKSSFRNSRGKGYIELRCAAENSALKSCEATLSFKLSISSDRRTEKFRGSVFGNFNEKSSAGLVESQNEWDFGRIVDDSGTFLVILECDP